MDDIKNLIRGLNALYFQNKDCKFEILHNIVFVYFGEPFDFEEDYNWMKKYGWKQCGKDWFYSMKD
jgi:hypothetical protein